MFFPIPFAFPRQDGPGTAYAQGKRSLFIAILIGSTICVAIQLFVILDIMGGFIDGIVLAMGWYAVKQEMNLTWLCYFGMMGCFQGAMDVVRFIDRYVHTAGPWLVPVSFESFKAFLATFFFDIVQ